MSKIVDLSIVREEQEERETCRLWDEFHDAAAALYTYRDYDELVVLLQIIERVKTRIER